MSKTVRIAAAVIVAVLCLLFFVNPAGRLNRDSRLIAVDAPFDMPSLVVPSFAHRIIDIRDHGAAPDANTPNTAAFAGAIAACEKAGGGRVVVPAGTWLTGPIHLKSDVNLHLQTGAEIIFSTDLDDYLPPVFTRYEGKECYNYSPLVYANNCTNIAVTGPGKLNGRAKRWWRFNRSSATRLYEMARENVPVKDRVFGTEADGLRPSFLQTINCRNVLLEGFTITDGPMWTIHPVYCENVIVQNITLHTHGPNGDGVNPDSCKNVLVENCRFDTSDDGMGIKSGMDHDGRRVGRPCENIVVRNCTFGLGAGCDGVLSIGSDMSGDVRNVYIHDCTFDKTVRALRIKSKRGRGGIVENIFVENITVGRVGGDALLLNMFYASDPTSPLGEHAPIFRNIHIKNLTCEHTRQAIKIAGLPDSPVRNVTLENIKITAEKGLTCKNAAGLLLKNVEITPEQAPVIDLENTCDVHITNSACPAPVELFLKLTGPKTKNIRLTENNLKNAKTKVQKDTSVPANALIHE